MEQKSHLRLIFKLHTAQLKKAGWNLNLPLEEAIKNYPDTVVSIGDSQVLRFIDELNGIEDMTAEVKAKQREIRFQKKQPTTTESKRRIRKLYRELYALQFQKDYLCVVMDRKSDYDRANKGFFVNGIRFRRFLGTNGGIKNSTIVYVNEKLYPELKRRLDNGRNLEVPLVPAKLEAYQALICSSSTPLPEPKGIIVVKDCFTKFKEDVILLDNHHEDSDPIITYVDDYEIENDNSDGYGLMLPSYSRRVSEYLTGESKILPGFVCRWAWCKGMIYPVDFIEFAEIVAHNYEIEDVWGDKRDIRNAEVILTESMLKLWNCYDSWEDYYDNCKKNKYKFCATKIAPDKLENARTSNYQFLQSFKLSDKDLYEMCEPDIKEIRDTLGLDYRKSIVFLAGFGLNENNVQNIENDFIKALMIDKRIIDDPFVRKTIKTMIKKRIEKAKIGSIKLHGNYAMASGDPYALMQSMFGLPVTGLLRAGEVYHRYWAEQNVEKIVCFRAPMNDAHNLKVRNVSYSPVAYHWFKHMKTIIVINAWDSTASALSGLDFDGDTVFTTDNEVMLKNFANQRTILCNQNKAAKTIVSEEDLIIANKLAFNDDIGKITNRVTAMFSVQAGYDEDTAEYKELDYRISCGNQFVQDAVDKCKGVIAPPMPKHWYNPACIDEDNELDKVIVADKKPYFMRYRYPDLNKRYRDYIKNYEDKAQIIYGYTLSELADMGKSTSVDKLPEDYVDFLACYNRRLPINNNACIVNRIAWLFENEFDSSIREMNKQEDIDFDYTILKSGIIYSKDTAKKVLEIYNQYQTRVNNFHKKAHKEPINKDDADIVKQQMDNDFKAFCYRVCPNEIELCDIVLDICYETEKSKQFAWAMCGDQIVRNLLNKNGGIINYPEHVDLDGDFLFCGEQFVMRKTGLEDELEWM